MLAVPLADYSPVWTRICCWGSKRIRDSAHGKKSKIVHWTECRENELLKRWDCGIAESPCSMLWVRDTVGRRRHTISTLTLVSVVTGAEN